MWRRPAKLGGGERGSAMVATILVMVVLTGLGGIMFIIGTNNLQNAGRDRLAGAALGTSEGGVAQGIAFIRRNGLSTLTCDDPPVAGTDCTQLWGQSNPKVVALSGGREYKVWIQRIQGFAPPDVKVATYRIHSSGTAGVGPAKRLVDVTIQVRPMSFPIGIYADNVVDAGTPTIRKESLFSQDCVTGREKIEFAGNDPYWDIPAAAHTTKYVAEKVNSGCSAGSSNNIHRPQPPPSNPGVCNASYPNDQDGLGGDLSGTSCLNSPYPTTSFFDLAALKTFGFSQPRGLTAAEYAALKGQAQEQGTYFTDSKFSAPSDPPPYLNAVYYFKLKSGDKVTIQNELNVFGTAHCGTRSVVVVVEGGDMHVNAGADIVGAFFVPDGNYQGNGNHKIIGTLFAETINKLSGTADFSLSPDPPQDPNCFFKNLPGGLLDVTTQGFREVDR